MSMYNPPTLVRLAMQCLLRNDAFSISALKYLPIELFPPLFKLAFHGRHTKILKTMVAAWPFPCLPVGVLMKTPEVETLQAVLDGIDILLMQKTHPRRCKLQVLDLRNVHQDFWDVWAGEEDGSCSAETVREKQVANRIHRYARRQRLKVVTDLSLYLQLKEHQMYLLQWAQQRKSSVHLHCLKMKICAFPVEIIRDVLDIFKPHYIEELELYTNQVLSFMGHFAPFLGQMINLRKFHLSHIYLNSHWVVNTLEDREKNYASTFFAQFSKLNCLQHLSMSGIYLSTDDVKQFCRYLKTPLESLTITRCHLSESVLKHLSVSQSLRQLKQLNLSERVLTRLHPTGLQLLLKSVADTLKTLELQHSNLNDSHLRVLLPALSQCSQLTRVNFYDNNFSMAALKDLLYCMANLNKLTVELYPAPLECYDQLHYILVNKISQLCPELLEIIVVKRQPKTITFATVICLECCQRCVYDLKTKLCQCWQ